MIPMLNTMQLRITCALLLALVFAGAVVAQSTSQQLPPANAAKVNPLTSRAARFALPALQLPANSPVMRVGVFHVPPYAMQISATDGEWVGLAVNLFREIAQNLKMKYQLVEYPSMQPALDDLAASKLDFIAVGLDATPDLEIAINFSHAFEKSGTSAAVRLDHTPSIMSMLQSVLKSNLPLMLLWTVGLMVVVAVLMMLLERTRNQQNFGGSWIHAFGETLWWSVTTMTTVGYGDRVPTTRGGRLLGGMWMVLAFALMSVLAGVIASELTISRFQPTVNSLSELVDVRCGAVKDTAAFTDALERGMNPHPYPNLNTALEALQQGQISAVLGDTNAMQWKVRQPQFQDLTVIAQSLVNEFVCFGLSPTLNEKVCDPFNYWLLRVSESSEWHIYRRSVFGAD